MENVKLRSYDIIMVYTRVYCFTYETDICALRRLLVKSNYNFINI